MGEDVTVASEAYYETSRVVDADAIHRGDDTWVSKVVGPTQTMLDALARAVGCKLEGQWKDS